MKSLLIGTALLSAAILSGPAFAQTASPERSAENAATTHRAGQWRASKLPGVDVYNEQNEKIGDVSDIILDSSGKASKVIVGVGGFLGMGERDVAIDFDKVKWMNEPVRSTTASADTNRTDGGMRTTTGTAMRRDSDKRDNSAWYPDHAKVSATKDQLKSMPEFKY